MNAARPKAELKIMYDTIIIGAGPAGWTAAIYTARAGLKTLLLGILKNSNAYKAHVIENYWGFKRAIKGPRLMERGRKQALRFGTKALELEVVDIKRAEDGTFVVTDSQRQAHQAKSIIICSGLGFKPSGIKNERQFSGKGVSFCVTCDGYFFKGKKCVVIGATNFAGEQALQLLSFTNDVTIASHGKDFSFSEKMQEGLATHGIILQKTTKITEFLGDGSLKKLHFADGTEMKFTGAFLSLGVASAADFAAKLGITRTGPQNAFIVADPHTGETNVKGVYAAGDCTGGAAQAAKSSGEGCNAALSVIKYVKGITAYVDYN